jgi:hypothetical protein
MNDWITWVVLGLAILFCGTISIAQLVLVFQGRGSGALALFVVSGLVTAGLITVVWLRVWRGKSFRE